MWGGQKTLQRLKKTNIVFIFSLFNDTLSNSEYTASNERMISEWWIAKNVEGSGRGLI
jgi:hypothetical protein